MVLYPVILQADKKGCDQIAYAQVDRAFVAYTYDKAPLFHYIT